ncbi:MAG: hypothetical protein IKF14_13345 [Atopobiaceae bacterium]|nr:hypothetical protein [Atopobiaceae bacterium]
MEVKQIETMEEKMFVLMGYHKDSDCIESMTMCGAYDELSDAVEHMRSNYENKKNEYEIADPFIEWDTDCEDNMSAELSVKGSPSRWVWAIFDNTSHRCIWF